MMHPLLQLLKRNLILPKICENNDLRWALSSETGKRDGGGCFPSLEVCFSNDWVRSAHLLFSLFFNK